nr:MAG: ORF1 [Torque teno midi virus]
MPWKWRYPRYRRTFTKAWRTRKRRGRRLRRRRARSSFPRRRTWYSRYRKTRRRVRKRQKKKKFINLVQWQPENIRKCKIIGYKALIQCGQGKQCYNYNQHELDICLKNESYGGGFTILTMSLDFLYNEWIHYNNVWTTGNAGFDLVRYTGTSMWFFRHPHASFVVSYVLSPPFTVDRATYTNTNPYRMLMQRHRFFVPSLARQPRGKRYIKKKFKVPKLLMNKWYFQADFSDTPFLMLKASVIGLDTPYLKFSNDNNCVGLTCLNPEIFDSPGFWEGTQYSMKLHVYSFKKTPSTTNSYTLTELKTCKYDENSIFWWQYLDGTRQVFTSTAGGMTTANESELKAGIKPLTITYRYQPQRDDGKDNVIFLESVVTKKIDLPTNPNYRYDGLPLWLLLHGWIDWCSKFFRGDNIYDNYTLCLRCKYLYPIDHKIPGTTLLLPLSTYFMTGKNEYGYPLTNYEHEKWAPTIRHQVSVINDICMGGPYSSLPAGKSFALGIKYKTYVKWGGTVVHPQTVTNPDNQEVFPLPTEELQRLQVKDPSTQDFKAEFHKWDYRRGMLTSTAIKRALQDSDSEILSSTDSEEDTRKRRKLGEPDLSHPRSSISTKVQEACEKAIFQTSQKEESKVLQYKLRNQRLQQLILRGLIKIERRQQLMGLTTGHLE